MNYQETIEMTKRCAVASAVVNAQGYYDLVKVDSDVIERIYIR